MDRTVQSPRHPGSLRVHPHGGTAESPLGDVNLDPGGYALFGRSDDPTVNGGLDGRCVLFALNNSRDRIVRP